LIFSCSVTKTVRSNKEVVSKNEIPPKKKSNKPTTKVVVKRTYAEKVQDYLDQFSPIAQAEMWQYKIPASITLAQGILESGTGSGRLAREGNNHFGIKCHRGWNGGRMYHDDDEKGECFRTYGDPAESYRDHSIFLSGRERYAFLFKLPRKDYKSWAKGLKKAGYATDPKYPKKLIGIIERYELYQYDVKKGKQKRTAQRSKPKANKSSHKNIHRVVTGDTLYSISSRYNISVNQLIKENNLRDNTIFKGQELIIPKSK
jgi:flagellum-specific peptidoglycan hydrolase FlgJ